MAQTVFSKPASGYDMAKPLPLNGALDRDLADMDRSHGLLERIAAARAEFDRRPYDARADAELTRARWLVEELRVSCFAQTLGTPNKVSFKRVALLIEQAS